MTTTSPDSSATTLRRELANTIALQADALAQGTVTHERAAVLLLLSNAQTLAALTIGAEA